MMRRRSLAIRLPAMLVTVVLAACTGTDETEARRMANLEQQSYDEAAVRAKERADSIATLLDESLTEPYFSPSPCRDPAGNPSHSGVFNMHTSFTLYVGEGRGPDALRTAHAHFVEQGHQVEDIRWAAAGEGRVKAVAPDGFSYRLISTSPPVAVALWVDSPCYQAPEGEVEALRWVPPPQVCGAPVCSSPPDPRAGIVGRYPSSP